ncbi:MAG TPA: AAA family ATPase, partial [Gaiellaceae bacterium]|nr:AAA family ATPase [Gaiellaceae bacterium]
MYPNELTSIGRDRPSAYIPGDRRRALATGSPLPTRVVGAGLFADISGFTPLSEALALELGSQRASEALTGHLNRVFHAVIAELDRFGGEVIYFSGDAITCWLDGDDGLRAAAAGVAMQAAMERESEITTPGGRVLRLALKVAIATGPARRFVVGNPEVQLMDVLAGGIVDRLAEAEHYAEPGEVVVESSAFGSLAGRAELSEPRGGPDGVEVAVLERLLEDVAEAAAPAQAEVSEELARPWLLAAVYERLATGSGEFLAELRPAYPMFVNFGGIDYDGDEAASEKLDEFVREAQRVLSADGGNLLQLTLGDKGAYLYGVFGTPFAHEDDAARACAAALELQALEATTSVRDIRIGITHGRLRSGTYGHARRRTFVCLGDAVNLSARLMSKAPAGRIFVSELVRHRAGDGFTWEELAPLELKGKSAPVAAFSLTGSSGRRFRRVLRYALPMVGRSAELAVLEEGLEGALAGRGGIVGLSAEAGMGKSRLIAEFVREARRRGVLVGFGECQSFGTSTGYFVWREIWRTLLGIPDDGSLAEQRVALESTLGSLAPELVPRAPLLDAVLGLPIQDNELTRSLDAKLRKSLLENALADCLRAKAATEPLVIVLEDCHWLDALSRDLLETIARAVPVEPVLLVVAYRPEAALPQGLALGSLPELRELPLTALDDETMSVVAGAKVVQLLGEDADLGQAFLDMVVGRAQGNPFYAEELLNYVHAQEIDPADDRALRSLELPDSLHSLLLSRIDTLTESPRQTLKVASVVGRVFRAPMLLGMHSDLGGPDDVRTHLGTLQALDLVNPDREEDESYLFRHAVTQEVTYESLPFALRAALHTQAGRFIETERPAAIDRNLDLLAHHYGLSDDEERKRLYLRRAGEAAQASYANSAAIDYFERLAPLVPDAERIDVLLSLGKVLELIGDWGRARAVDEDALVLAATAGNERDEGWCEVALAEVARKQGVFDEVGKRLDRARELFERAGEAQGVAQALHVAGTVAAQHGDTAEARKLYEASLAIREELDDRKSMAALLSNLGIMAEWDGECERGLELHERALALRRELGDRWAIAVSMTNIGMNAMHQKHPADAVAPFREAMRLN